MKYNYLKKGIIIGYLLLIITFCVSVDATTLRINSTDRGVIDDAHTRYDQDTQNYGAAIYFLELANGSGERRALIKFNASLVPSGKTITSSILSVDLYAHNLGAGESANISAYCVYNKSVYAPNGQEWDEGNGSATGDTGVGNDLTWLTQPNVTQYNSTKLGTQNFTSATSTGRNINSQ